MRRRSVPALFCRQSTAAPTSRRLSGRHPYTRRPPQSLRGTPTASRDALQNRRFHFKARRSPYNRFFTALVYLYYLASKRRSQPYTAPHSTRAKITRLAVRQDGHYYWSTPGHRKHRAPFPALIIPRAVSPGARAAPQWTNLESRTVDSRWLFQSRLIVDSRLIVVRHSRSILHNATLDAVFKLLGIGYITQRIVWREHNLRFIYKSVVVLLPPHQSDRI